MVRIDSVQRDVPIPTLNGEIRNILYRGMEPKKQDRVVAPDNIGFRDDFESYRAALASIPVRPAGRRNPAKPD